MLERAGVLEALSNKEFSQREKALREPLLDAQFALREEGVATLIILGGLPAAGRGAVADQLVRWLDNRHVITHALSPPTDVERLYPSYYRYWRRLPRAGSVGLMFGSWYKSLLRARVWEGMTDDAFYGELERIARFEAMLCADGMVLIKNWLHITRTEQRSRLEALEEDPNERWRVDPDDWLSHARYDLYQEAAERMLTATHTSQAPWNIIPSGSPKSRDIAVGEYVLSLMQKRVDNGVPERKLEADRPTPEPNNALRSLDQKREVDKETYNEQLAALQARMGRLSRAMSRMNKGLVLVFEGQDAAGKGGAIQRLTSGLDARSYQVHSIAAPTAEDRAFPYLWRFWRRLPRRGQVAIFDRSWYGRVMVERIEGFCTREDWMRASGEINDFEEQLRSDGFLVLKFWVGISNEEQLARFEEREKTSHKRHKLTEEDWRNREAWDAYEAAACEMFERTTNPRRPWVLVEGDNKQWARLKVVRSVAEFLERELGLEELPPAARL